MNGGPFGVRRLAVTFAKSLGMACGQSDSSQRDGLRWRCKTRGEFVRGQPY